ncbi:MAG: patatin family protein [Defluviitaleaceae bacterium]|nr:patatin family protein [Defluviitaleaceae bacterium]
MGKFGLVLEGGGLRGVYTAGVLDLFLDMDFHAPYTVAVSAGACQAYSYISRQRGRNFKVASDFIGDPRYLSFRSLILKGEIFGMDFMFDEVPKRLIPFDFEAFDNSAQEFVIAATNCESGLAEYFNKSDKHDMFLIGRASSSLPLLSRIVQVNNTPYLDGGVVVPIPYEKALADGYEKNIVILTQDSTYIRRHSQTVVRLMRAWYRKYPKLAEVYSKRAENYNKMMIRIIEEEKKGNIFVIRPVKTVTVSRIERNKEKLKTFYEEGFEDAKRLWPKLQEWLGKI